MSDQRSSDCDQSKRDIPSFIEPQPPLILNPFMRPRPEKGINLLELFDDSESEEPEWLQVYLRLKPCNVRNNLYEVKSDRCLITSVDTAPMGHGIRTQHNISKMYTFSYIYGPESSQKEIFENVVKGNLRKLPEGHNFTLLTYGASGSGKTYTLMGTVQAPGLVPRSLEYVFHVVDAAQRPMYKPIDGGTEKLDYKDQDYEIQFVKKLRHLSAPVRDKYRRMSVQLRDDLTSSTFDLSNRTRYYVWVSFVEIYNEAIYDLLSNSDRSKATSKLRIREDTNGNVYVKGATHAFVRTGEEAYDIMVAGKHNLQVAATGVHANSSRSHCIFTITMLTETEQGVRSSCVRLCDLAGCERARHTKNTGARMQESRSINSSLHVLERCLHMLRRKQKKVDATLVPYRESKLTRLLGAGLSGARGEAVSMVVTLNPSPQYAHETKHVLQLAAVAKDIHVNQTIAESVLESSSQDSTAVSVESSAELMRLRAENERLHFELVQAEACNRALSIDMEKKQQEASKAMYEVMEEAQDISKQYYEAKIKSLRSEMDEMQEEYENKLKIASAHASIQRDSYNEMGTPSKSLKIRVAELITEIATLEEQLTAEKLARARAEEEVQHLRACIEERDGKADEGLAQNNEGLISVSDSETDEEDDPYNESLEPTFKKEDINRSRLLQQSLNNSKLDATSESRNHESDNDSVTNGTLKDDMLDDTMKDSNYLSESNTTQKRIKNSSFSDESNTTDNYATKNSFRDSSQGYISKAEDQIIEHTDAKNATRSLAASVRDTFVITDDIMRTKVNDMSRTKVEDMFKIPPPLDEDRKSITQADEMTDVIRRTKVLHTTRSDVSLAQFEQYEEASKSDSRQNRNESFYNIRIPKEKRNFFDDTATQNELPKLNKNKSYFDNIDVNVTTNKNLNEVKQLLSDDRSPSIVKEDDCKNFESSKIKKLLGESFTRQSRLSVPNVSLPKKHNSVDIFDGFDSPNIIKINSVPEPNVNTTSLQIDISEKHKTAETRTTKDVSTLSQNDKDFQKPGINTKVKEKIAESGAILTKTLSEKDTEPNIRVNETASPGIFSKVKDNISLAQGLCKKVITVEEDSLIENKALDCEKPITSSKLLDTVIMNKKVTSRKELTNNVESEVFKKPPMSAKTRDNLHTNDTLKNMTHSIKLEKMNADEKNEEKHLPIFEKSISKRKENQSIFEQCIEKVSLGPSMPYTVETTRKSIENLILKSKDDKIMAVKIKQERPSVEPETDECHTQNNYENLSRLNVNFSNNTVEDFENIYKDITEPRATEFELLVSQVNSSNVTVSNMETDKYFEKPLGFTLKYNLRHGQMNKTADQKEMDKRDKSTDERVDSVNKQISDDNNDKSFNRKGTTSGKRNKSVEKKVNTADTSIAKRDKSIDKNRSASSNKHNSTNQNVTEEVLLESEAKRESKKPKRNLRLRRGKNVSEEETNQTQETVGKLKDIVNLQKEFSDVTMDVPAPLKESKDIESPEKIGEENRPPLLGVQSCPSKSVTRSRRKLFTPRAEPLEESMAQSGDSNERVRIPRPSYHRTRARRKL